MDTPSPCAFYLTVSLEEIFSIHTQLGASGSAGISGTIIAGFVVLITLLFIYLLRKCFVSLRARKNTVPLA
jgi:hypothetical protein